jgi:hypothetical protein
MDAESTDIDNSFLSLLFDENIYIDTQKASKPTYSLVIYATHNRDSLYEENLIKCFQRLGVDLKSALRSADADDLNTSTPCMIFSDEALKNDSLPALKYVVENNKIWFNGFETISKDAQLKLVFWDKFQEFLK